MNRLLLVASVAALAISSTSFAQQKYTLSNTSGTLLKDRNSIALDNETPATAGNGQGQLILLGYFSAATDVSLFSGTFMPLAQFRSGDSSNGTDPVPNGRISLLVQFDLSLNATNFPGDPMSSAYPALSAYPSNGAPLAIRWFDTHTTSGNYNTMSATNWDWIAPTGTPSSSFVLSPSSATGLLFQDNANPYIASLAPVPEPTALGLIASGGLGLLLRRRRMAW